MIEWEKEKRFVLKSEQSQEIHFNALNFAINCIDVKSYFDCASEMLTEIVKQIIIAFGLSVIILFPQISNRLLMQNHRLKRQWVRNCTALVQRLI